MAEFQSSDSLGAVFGLDVLHDVLLAGQVREVLGDWSLQVLPRPALRSAADL